MPTEEIDRDKWAGFLESFSLQHQGWLVTIEVMGADIGAQVESTDLPLQGITADLKGSDAPSISIMVGEKADDHVTHTIHGPTVVRLRQNEQGADEALEIESAAETTIVRFRSAMRAEMVDGIL
ncbi:MAG TPA: DUF5335 family protein [Blastocatellia bacterium]|nr:DUF5335 family protein [Blastocatellia bacterium]